MPGETVTKGDYSFDINNTSTDPCLAYLAITELLYTIIDEWINLLIITINSEL